MTNTTNPPHSSSSIRIAPLTPPPRTPVCYCGASAKLSSHTVLHLGDDDDDDASSSRRAATAALTPTVLIAEFVATFIFMFVCDASSAADVTPLAAALASAAILAAMLAAFMPVSGAHLNPSVTFAFLATGRIQPLRALAYVCIQIAAALLASWCTQILGFPLVMVAVGNGASDIWHTFFTEFIPVFILITVIFQTGVMGEKEGGVGARAAGVYIGATFFAIASTFGGFFNPAKALGPAVVTGVMNGHWIYWVAPLSASLLAATVAEHTYIAPIAQRKPQGWLSYLICKIKG